MAKYTVYFDVRKNNNVTGMNTTVECNSEFLAVQMAETKLKNSNPLHRDYDWSVKKIVEV
ncbi:hypothetical protein [Pseudoxanthomonas mexicana]